MPIVPIKLNPGVKANLTPSLNEAGYQSANLVRFNVDGLPEKWGGWQKFFPLTFGSQIRQLHPWQDLNSIQHLAIGAEQSLDALTSGVNAVITPQSLTGGSTTATVTITIASPAVVTWTAHGFSAGQSVIFTTTGALPTGLTAGTVYYVIAAGLTTNAFEVSATLAGGAINTSGTQSGVQTGTTAVNVSTSASSPVVTIVDVGSNAGANDAIVINTPIAIDGLILMGAYAITTVLGANSYTITASSNATAGVSNGGALPVFTTTSGQSTVSVALTAHGLSTGNTFPFIASTTVGGITIQGLYPVTVANANTFTITTPTQATSSTSATMNAGSPQIVYWIAPGASPATTGYSFGGYSSGGYGTGSSPTYHTGTPITTTNWSLDNWGELLVAAPRNGPIFQWGPRSGLQAAQLIPQAPLTSHVMFVATPQQIMVSCGSSVQGIYDPLLIRWCTVGNFTVWTADGTNQAGSYRIPSGSLIVGALQGPQQNLVWTDIDLWSMSYIGATFVFGFNKLSSGCGLIAKSAVTILGAATYWMSQKQFFVYANGYVQPLPCEVWDQVFQNLNSGSTNGLPNTNRIRAGSNSQFNEVMWYYPSANGTGENDSYVKYNPVYNSWDYGSLQRTAWIDQSVLGAPLGADASGYVYQHETTPDADGAPMHPSIRTGYFAIAEGDQLAFVDWFWPDFKYGVQSGSSSATITVTLYVADYADATPVVFGPYSVSQAVNYINTRLRGRLVSIQWQSDDVGSFWRLGNLRYRVAPDGKR